MDVSHYLPLVCVGLLLVRLTYVKVSQVEKYLASMPQSPTSSSFCNPPTSLNSLSLSKMFGLVVASGFSLHREATQYYC